MRSWQASLTGIDTRVAARTLALFVLCAVVPIALTGWIADRVVSHQLRSEAVSRLEDTSKAYGLLVFDRLKQTDQTLAELVSLYLRGRLSYADLRGVRSDRFHIINVSDEINEVASSSQLQTMRGTGIPIIEVLHGASGDKVVLKFSHAVGERRITLSALLADGYLWNFDALESVDTRVCVSDSSGTVLHCAGAPESASGTALAARWNLFLRPRYGVPAWTFAATVARELALARLDAFRRTLPLLMLIAVAVALLLGIVQIRRNHKPLAMLAKAVQELGSSGRVRSVVVDSNDEYASLARAFNRMSASLARQFEILRAQARVDRLILDDPEIGVVADNVVGTLPRLLGAARVAVALQARDGNDLRLYIARAQAGAVVEHQRVSMQQGLGDLLAGRRLVLLPSADPRVARLCAAMDAAHLAAVPIRLAERARGALLLDAGDGTVTREQRRHARSFARRISVALAAEDRREALLQRAYYDELTGLPNRQLFRERCSQELVHARRDGRRLALVYLDLDRFKDVNDSLGHSAGDVLLREVSARWAAQLAEGDTLARLGGDEFVLVAVDNAAEPVHLRAERMLACLREPVEVDGSSCFVEASIGITVFPADGDCTEILLRNADTAMYRAKAAGRGQVVYFEENMNLEVQRRHLIEQRLRSALAAGRLGVLFQPKISTGDGQVCGVEALSRWHDEELGIVPPAVFIPVAEECGLIRELGATALRSAGQAYRQWRSCGLDIGHIGVNVSLRQLSDEDFVPQVLGILAEAGMPPDHLEIEITESMLADNPQQIARQLRELRAVGVRISIDDFGTGYSSMAVLGQLPADSLKIDRSFVTHCATDSSARSVVEAIIAMAHALGKKTVAEGIESLEQLHALRELGCDMVQGYLLSPPLTVEGVREMVQDGHDVFAPFATRGEQSALAARRRSDIAAGHPAPRQLGQVGNAALRSRDDSR